MLYDVCTIVCMYADNHTYTSSYLIKSFLVSETATELVVKAQILAGGRGKGVFENGFKGGVHLTKE